MTGLVTHVDAEQCHTPSGCIDAVLPEKAVEMLVKFMNLRREARVAWSFTKMADETRNGGKLQPDGRRRLQRRRAAGAFTAGAEGCKEEVVSCCGGSVCVIRIEAKAKVTAA